MAKRKLSNIQKNFTAVIYRTALYIKTGCASTIQTSLIVFGLLRFWFNLLVRSVV